MDPTHLSGPTLKEGPTCTDQGSADPVPSPWSNLKPKSKFKFIEKLNLLETLVSYLQNCNVCFIGRGKMLKALFIFWHSFINVY